MKKMTRKKLNFILNEYSEIYKQAPEVTCILIFTVPQNLVVFASDKDRSAADAERHTNFKLSSSGEYLALVHPNGVTVEHQFAPSYPPQVEGVSFGLFTEVRTLVPQGAEVEVTIPNVTLVNNTLDFIIATEYQWNDNLEDVMVSVYNVSGSDWVLLSNNLTYALSDSIITSTLVGNESDYIDGSGNILVRYESGHSSAGIHTFRIDWVSLLDQYFISTPVTEIRGGGEVLARIYRPNTRSPMKIPEEMKKKDVLTKSEPRIGYHSGQNGEVQPIANIKAHMEIRIAARIQRLRSDKFASIFHLTVNWLLLTVCVFPGFLP